MIGLELHPRLFPYLICEAKPVFVMSMRMNINYLQQRIRSTLGLEHWTSTRYWVNHIGGILAVWDLVKLIQFFHPMSIYLRNVPLSIEIAMLGLGEHRTDYINFLLQITLCNKYIRTWFHKHTLHIDCWMSNGNLLDCHGRNSSN